MVASRTAACAAILFLTASLAGCASGSPDAGAISFAAPTIVPASASAGADGIPDGDLSSSAIPVPASYAGGTVTNPVPGALPPHLRAGGPNPELDGMIAHYAREYGVPVTLVHRVVKRESTYNPRAYNNGHYGLMQIKPATARGMGYRGPADGLFDAETNLRWAVKYLRGAWLLANGSEDRAVRLYAAGYYYVAKQRGMLVETGLKPG